jgi:hypothetical protein
VVALICERPLPGWRGRNPSILVIYIHNIGKCMQ